MTSSCRLKATTAATTMRMMMWEEEEAAAMKKLTPAGTKHHHHHDTTMTLPTAPTTSLHDDKQENEHSTTSGSTSDDDDDEETSLRGWIRCPKNNKGAGGTRDEEETASIVSELTLATTLLQSTKTKTKKKTKKKAKKNKARKAKSSTSKQSPGEETTPVRPRGAVTKKGLTSVQEDEAENLRVMILQDEEALSEKKIDKGLPPSFGGCWDQGAGSSFRSYSTATSSSLKPPSSNGILTDASPPQPQRKPSLSPPGRSWMSRLAQNSTTPPPSRHAMMPHLSDATLTHTTTGAGRFALPFKKSTSLRSFDPQGPTYFGTPRPPRGASLLEMTRSNASERSLCRHGAPPPCMLPYYYYPMHHSASSSLSYEDYPSEPFIFHGNHEIAPYQEEDDLLLQSLIMDETEATTHSSSGPFSVDHDDSFHNNKNKPRKATLRGLRKQFQGLKKKLLFRGGKGANDTAAVDATGTSKKKEPVVATPPHGNGNTRKTSTTRPSLRSSMMKRAASLSVLGKGRNVKKTSAAAPSRDSYCDYYGDDPFAFDSEASTATPQVASQKAPLPSKMAMQRSVSSNQVMAPTEKSRRKAFQKSSSIKNKKKPLSAKDLRRCMEEQHNTSVSEEEDSKKRLSSESKKSSKKNVKARKSVTVASTQERGSPYSSLQVSRASSVLDPSRQKPTRLPRAASLNQLGLLVDPDRSIHKDEAPSLPQRKQDHEATPTPRAALLRVDHPPTPPKRSSQKKKKTPKSKAGLSPRGGGASKSKRSTRRIQKPVGMGPSSLGSRSTTSSNREDFDSSEQHDLVSPLWSERSSMGSAGSYSKRRLVSVSPNAILPFVLDLETQE